MDNLQKDKKALKIFFAILIPMSIVLEAAYMIVRNDLLILILMWIPGIAGIITASKYYKKEKALGMKIGKIKYILAGIVIPIVYLLISYAVAWLAVEDKTIGVNTLAEMMGYQSSIGIAPALYLGIFLFTGLFSSCLSAAGEEIGWRGFMYPVMERVIGRKKALLFSGLIWAVWHMPLIIAGLYQAKTTLLYGLCMFAVELTLMSIIMSWLRVASNSVWPAIFLHASHNLFDQTVFQPMSTNSYVPYWAGEQGFVTVLVVLVIAFVVMHLWKKKECNGKGC